jgi:hypothetical protein
MWARRFCATGLFFSAALWNSAAVTYQSDARLTYRLNKYVDDVVEFNGANLANDEVKSSDISGRALALAIPKGSMTVVQQRTIEAARLRAKLSDRPVDIFITEF